MSVLVFLCRTKYPFRNAIILLRLRFGYLTLIVCLMCCDCYCDVSFPHGAMGWSAVGDYVISWSYSLVYLICWSMFCNADPIVLSSFAITSLKKRELIVIL